MVGNYGVPDPNRVDDYGLKRGFESSQIQASALIVQEYSRAYSHWDAHMSLGDWLQQEVGRVPEYHPLSLFRGLPKEMVPK